MNRQVIQIGTVKSDSGKLIFCDPLYLQNWENHSNLPPRKYKHVHTGKIYIQGQILLRIEEEPTDNFSYHSINKNLEKEGYYQSKFPNGKTGMAITILLDSDGEYPIYAELEGDILKKIWIDF